MRRSRVRLWRQLLVFNGMDNQNEFLNEVKKVVLSFDGKAEVILYGSRARGDYKEDSDWDLLIITSIVLNNNLKEALRDELYKIEVKHLQDLSSIIIDRAHWEYWEIMPLYKNVAREGFVL